MGRVFSPEAITAGDYPKPGAHERAASDLMTKFAVESQMSGFAGMAYGSTSLGYENIRSDLDVLGVSSAGAGVPAVHSRVAGYIADVTARWQVPVEANIVSIADLIGRRRQFARDYLFIEHLARVARSGKYVVGDVETQLRPLVVYDSSLQQWSAARAAAEHYTRWKSAYFLAGAVAAFGRPDYHKLQRAFELPSALGRKLLRFAEITEWTREHSEQDASYPEREFYARQSLAERLRQLFADTRYAASVDWLAGHDSQYTQLLWATLQGHTSVADYEVWLKSAHRPAMRHALRLCVGASMWAKRQTSSRPAKLG